LAKTVMSYDAATRKDVTVKQFPIAEIMKKPPGCQ